MSRYIQPSFAPIATLQECTLEEANALLVEWSHKMGVLDRGVTDYGCAGQYVLLHESKPVAVCAHATIVRSHVGGGLQHMQRPEVVELARLCAERPGLCRVMLRCWREFVFPGLGRRWAISYQDADLHNGNTYRFDGWTRSPEQSRSGTDQRTGKVGRNKWIWFYELRSSTAMERAS